MVNYFTTCPVCSPARAALLTGRYSTEVGIPDYIPGKTSDVGLDASYPNWVRDLAAGGYDFAELKAKEAVRRFAVGLLHYLRTRGVGRDEAEVMLSYGFINELVEALDNEALKDFLHPLLARRLSRDPLLTRHLA